MSLWSRIANVFRAEGPSREIDEELQSHITEALEHGRDSAEVRRSFGSPVHHAEHSRDVRLITWLDSLRADAIFGWRQLSKKKITSAAAILSLGLAIGSCTSAFRPFDGITDDGQPDLYDSCSYPMFRQWRAAVKDRAELIAMSYAERVDLTYTSDLAMEKAYRQYVSGWMFGTFGLRPVLGRLLTEKDDITPGAHPYAVLSYDYWSHRFGQDLHAIGRTFRMDNDLYEIVGVTPEGFTGTEPGTMPDIFVPTMMNVGSVNRSNSFWFRTFVQLKPGIALEPLRDELYATYRAFEQERAKTFTNFPKHLLEGFPRDKLLVTPAVAGVSEFARQYFGGDDPVGKSFETIASTGKRVRFQIVGLAGDARYQKLRESMLPVAYVPFQSAGANGAFEARWRGTFIVRTSRSNPLALASILRQEVPRARSGFRVTNIRTQQEINESHTVRERLLAMLALFFSVVALLLAGIGLYGVLDFSVLQRRREIGIRMALGARAGHVVGRVTLDVFSMMLLGAIAGIAIGLGCGRYIQSMLYEVKPTDWSGLGLPALAILAAGLIAALPAVIRAVRINPANILRSE
jgi:MacB-like periplasmic core domain/FtsX-like permease family